MLLKQNSKNINEHHSLINLMNKKEDLHPDLLPYLHKQNGFVCLKHPLIFSVPYIEQLNALHNAQYEAKKQEVEKAKEEKNWSRYLIFHERPYRFEAFAQIFDQMDDKEYWENLGWIWTDTENLWQVKKIVYPLIQSKRPEKKHLMNEREQHFLQSLPEQFIVYRGHNHINKNGFSWTLSYWKANWFAHRFHKPLAGVVRAIVNKEDVLAFFEGRGEYEVVVDYKKVKKQQIKELNRPDWMETIRNSIIHNFQLEQNSYHGQWHWDKVEKNALTIADKTPSADKLVCQLFALLHDSKRQDENDDPKHGHRAAAYVKKLYHCGDLPIDTNQLEKLVFACNYHNDGKISDDPTIGSCWDADRIDLPRVNITPDPKFLSTEAGKNLMWAI